MTDKWRTLMLTILLFALALGVFAYQALRPLVQAPREPEVSPAFAPLAADGGEKGRKQEKLGPPRLALREKNPPINWKVADLNERMPYRWEDGSVHVVVWEIIDNGDRVMERCLVLKQYKEPSDHGETCALAYLLRFPKDKKPEWHDRTLWITPDPKSKNPPAIWGFECYKALPTDKQIAKFLHDRSWDGEITPSRALRMSTGKWKDYHPKLTDGGVCQPTWKEAFGRNAPTDLFPELVLAKEPGKK